MVQKTISATESAEELKAQESIRKRAAKQAAKRELAPVAPDIVECTVLPLGHEKVSMGVHAGGLGEAHYEEGEEFHVALPIALALYRRGYVNFPGAREAQEAERKAMAQAEIDQRAEKIALERALEQAGM